MAAKERGYTHEPEAPKYPIDAPFTVWPDPGVGYRVVDLRTGAWVTRAHRTLAEAFETMYRLNRQEAALAGDLAPLTE